MTMAMCFFIKFLDIFHTKGERYSGFKLELVKIASHIVSRTILATQGFYFGVKVERPKVDYSRYLGKDWEPTYNKSGTVICNHSTMNDIIVQMYFQPPSHIAKASVKNFPFIGTIATAVGNLYIDRSDST